MPSIRISDAVWEEIAKRGVFGETEDDVLRRVFSIDDGGPLMNGKPDYQHPVRTEASVSHAPRVKRRQIAVNNMMHARVYSYPGKRGDYLRVLFRVDGSEDQWDLPEDRSNKAAMREVVDLALKFGEEHGASLGQLNAIRKALTDADYHLTK